MKTLENKQQENIMGTKSEGRLLFSMSLPMMLSVLVSSLYNIVDSIFVGRLGGDALMAISLGAPASSLMTEFSFGIAVGVNAILSKKFGEKDSEGVSKVVGQGFLLSAALYFLFLIAGIFGSEAFYRFQTDNEEIIKLGTDYTSIVMTFSFGLVLQSLCERLLSATGRTKYSMTMLLTGAITNTVLDPILIFGLLGFPSLGIRGAAIATVLSQCAAGGIGLFLNIKKNPDITFRARSFLPDFKMIGAILVIAVPTTLTYSINSLLIFGMNQVLISVSLVAPAVYIIYNRVRSFVALPVWGIRNTLISIVAYNIGAKKFGRVKRVIKIALASSAVIMLFGTVLYETIPGLLLSVFSATDEMLEIGKAAFRIIGITLTISGVTIMASGVFQATDESRLALVVSIVQAAVLVGSAALLALTKSVTLVWWAFPISEIVIFVLSMIFLKKIWKGKLSESNANIEIRHSEQNIHNSERSLRHSEAEVEESTKVAKLAKAM